LKGSSLTTMKLELWSTIDTCMVYYNWIVSAFALKGRP